MIRKGTIVKDKGEFGRKAKVISIIKVDKIKYCNVEIQYLDKEGGYRFVNISSLERFKA